MSVQVEQIIQQMGLSEGYHIPIANTENADLEAKLQQLILAKAKATTTLESLNTRCSGLEKHIKYVRSEQMDNQNLLLAQNTQLENEKNMYTVIRMKRERYLQEIRKMTNDHIKIEENKQNKNSNLKTLMNKMDQLKLSVKWDEQVIETLEQSMLKKSNDNELIKKFSKEDQRKSDELEIKRIRLREEELNRRQLVTRIANEIECMQLTLGRNVFMYKQMNEERNAMVQQWQDSVKQLQQRNRDTISVIGETAAMRDLIRSNKQVFEEQHQFLANEQSNNHEMEMSISTETTEIARLRTRLSNCNMYVQDRNVELSGVSRELRQTATALEEKRAERRRVDRLIENERKLLDTAIATVDNLHKQLTVVQETNMSADERIRRLDELKKTEEASGKIFMYDIEHMQGVLFRSSNILVDLVETFKLKELAQKNYETELATLHKLKAQFDIDYLQATETMYKLNFRINMLENRIARASGDRHDEDSEVHHLRLQELEVTMVEVTETGNLLQSQIVRLEDDMRRLTSSSTVDAELLQTLKHRLLDRMLMVDGAVKLVAQGRLRNNKKRVDQNVLAVRVKGAERSLQREGGLVYGLQRQKMELETAIHERQAEISMEKELLFTKRRALQEDSGRMRADIQARQMRIGQLKTRHECVLESLGRTEDGEALSVTYFRVRNAQEKYALQQEGDRLDCLIKKAEGEIVAMENTLRVVNGTNSMYKKGLSMLDDDADELTELKNLEEQLCKVGADTRTRASDLINRKQIIRKIRACLEQSRVQIQDITETLTRKRGEYENMCHNEEERRNRMERAIASVASADCICGTEHKDMTMRQLREINKSALQQLSETSIRYLETSPAINRYLSEYGLSFAPVKVSSRTSDLNSKRSDVSSKSNSSISARSNASATKIPSVILAFNIP